MISIVIPTLNESKANYLPKILERYKGINKCQIVCVDGGSTDNTIEQIQRSSAELVHSSHQSRAGRLNDGITHCKYDMILLHHPRSIIEQEGINLLVSRSSELDWGAFTHRFDVKHPLLRFTSWYSNYVRGDFRKIYYLDHCIFVRKDLLEKIGKVPMLDIFEDTKLCTNLTKLAKPYRLDAISTTSAIRFSSSNMYRQAWLNQMMKWQYYLGYSDKKMNRRYERNLELNTEYQADQAKEKLTNKR